MKDDALLKTLTWLTESGVTDAISEHPVGLYALTKTALPKQTPVVMSTPVRAPVSAPSNSPPKTAPSFASISSLDELRKALESFDACSLKQLATNMVFSDGNPQARVMFIGEAPGAEEDRQGRPFVGLSGQLLDKIMASIGLSRTHNAYITNIIPWRPPGNRQPSSEEIAQCLPFVQRHIEIIKPEVLVFVGGISAKALLDTTTGIMRLRGQWQSYQSPGLACPIKAMATLHPAYLLRSPGQKALVWQDFIKIKKYLDEGQALSTQVA